MNIIKSLPHQLPDNCFVSLDVEMFGMNEKQLHRPNSGVFAALTICPNENDVYIIFDEHDVSKALQIVSDCVWIMHNAKFDVVQLRRYANIPPRKKLWDTLIMERVLWNGLYDSFSLASLVRRYLNIYVDKSLQSSFGDTTEMSEEQIRYSCLDSLYTRMVALEQKKIVEKDDRKIYSNVDLPAMWATLDYRGFPINVEKWKALAESNKERQDVMDETIPFNPRSWQQSKPWLIDHGFKGLPSTGKDVLLRWGKKYPDTEAAEMAKRIAESKMYGTRVSKYGFKFIEDYLEEENGIPVIHADYEVNKAETGREASSSPNMQNIPARDTNEFRDCFIPYPYDDLIIADYSAQEPRIAAYLSQDKKMMAVFEQEKDIYIEMAKWVFDEEITKKDPRRAIMKDTFLGMTYGLSKWGLAKEHNISVEDADQLLIKTFSIFPELNMKMNELAQNRRLVKTVLGRKCWLNPYSNQCERNGRNSPIQGTAAGMMKRAKSVIHQEWNWDCKFGMVNMVHDELVLSVPKELSSAIAPWVSNIMVQIGEEICPGILFKAEATIANSWAGK